MNYETALTILTYGLAVLGGLTVMLNALAPLTKTKVDDKVAGKLPWVVDKLTTMVLPFVRERAEREKAEKNK